MQHNPKSTGDTHSEQNHPLKYELSHERTSSIEYHQQAPRSEFNFNQSSENSHSSANK